MRPCAAQRANRRDLVGGHQPGVDFVHAEHDRRRCARSTNLSPVSMATRAMPWRRRSATMPRARLALAIGHRRSRRGTPSVARARSPATCRMRSMCSTRAPSAASQRCVRQKARRAAQHGDAVDAALGAQPRQRPHVGGARELEAASARLAHDGLRNRMFRLRSTEAAAASSVGLGACPATGSVRATVSFAARQRAGLVERHRRDRRPTARDRSAALDQHAVPRRAGERRHDRHRRRDDQRARAGHHQQHQRAIDPGARTSPPARTRARRRPRQRQRRRPPGVYQRREAIDELLRRRALAPAPPPPGG